MLTMHEIVGAQRQQASWPLILVAGPRRRWLSISWLSLFSFSLRLSSHFSSVFSVPAGIMHPPNSRSSSRLCRPWNASFTPTGREISRIRHRPVS